MNFYEITNHRKLNLWQKTQNSSYRNLLEMKNGYKRYRTYKLKSEVWENVIQKNETIHIKPLNGNKQV